MLSILDLEDDRDDEAEVTHLPEEDLGMPDPLRDQTQEQRQSTFRLNSLVWFRSVPGGRCWISCTISSGQQEAMRRWIKASGIKARKQELARRCAGHPPEYQIVKVTEGYFTAN